MKNPSVSRIAACRAAVAAALLAGASQGGVIWNESVQGDLSDNRFAPTHLPLAPGSNELFGVLSGANSQGFDRDYYSITIPDGYVLYHIVLELYFSTDFAAFVAVQPGPIFPDDPETVSPGDLLGWAHFGPDEQSMDLLAIMGTNGQGFTPPLPAGTYSFWAQQIDDFTEYAFDFVVEVP